MEVQIAEADSSVAETIESKLLESLRQTLTQSENTEFVLSATSPQASLIGGLTASTAYGWVLIKALWVDQSHRNQGIGRLLVESAETKARGLGCHSAWLDTSNPKAMRFYEALGYETFGQLENDAGRGPESHRRWFLKKLLSSTE